MVAKQESYIQTIKQQKDVVIVANCKEDQPGQGAPSQKVASR
jgi:hypothetical protein